MPFIISLALLMGSLEKLHLPEKLSNLSMILHQKCISRLPSTTAAVQAPLLCGENLPSSPWKDSLIRTSLIHLFVVSGSHLILLEQILIFAKCPLPLRILIWFFYALICGWQAPLVRALAGALVSLYKKMTGTWWPSDISILISGLIVLAFFPQWVQSKSLLMSWSAALALSIWPFLRHRTHLQKLFITSTSVYLVMLPFLWGFGNLHPLSILYNIFLSLPVTLWLWPLSFFSLLLPVLNPVLEVSAKIYLALLQNLSDPIAIQNGRPLGPVWLWFFILSLHGGLYLIRIFIRKGRV